MVAAPQKVFYRLNTGEFGSEPVNGDHMAPICGDGWMPLWLMSLFEGDGEVDAADYRYYREAMNAALCGDYFPLYDMGIWSNGTAVREVDQALS